MSVVQRVAVFLSGRGSNAAALLQAQQQGRLTAGRIALVVSNRANAAGLQVAAAHGVPTYVWRTVAFESPTLATTTLLGVLNAHAIDWVVLAGYDRIIPAAVTAAYAGHIINIHPSLLPKFGGRGMIGRAVHQAVLAAGETESGCTIHWVTDALDEGGIIAQTRVPVLPNDSADSLAQRVLEAEHQLYPETLQRLLGSSLTCHEATHVLPTPVPTGGKEFK